MSSPDAQAIKAGEAVHQAIQRPPPALEGNTILTPSDATHNSHNTHNTHTTTTSNATTSNVTPSTSSNTAHQPKVYTYGAHQNAIYGAGTLHGIRPTVTKDPNKLEQQAKEAMQRKAWCYVAGAAGERATLDANRLGFRCWKVCLILFLLCSSCSFVFFSRGF